MKVTICEHCGARVTGDVCEYCDMPVAYSPKYTDFSVDCVKSPQTSASTPSPSFIYSQPKKKKSKTHILPFLILIFVIFKIIKSIIIPSVMIHRLQDDISHSAVSSSGSKITEYESASEAKQVKKEKTSEKAVYSSNEIFEENGIYPAGTYEIGIDIPEGLYIFIPQQDGHGIEAIYSDPSCDNQISAEYVHFDGSRIAEISGKGYLETAWCTAYNLDMHPEIVNDPFADEGMFVVGRDIDAGTYKLCLLGDDCDEYGIWTIYSSINAIAPVACNSGTAYPDGECAGIIKLEEGQFFKTQYCKIEKRLD